MIRRLVDADELAWAQACVDRLMAGEVELSPTWLAESRALVVARESGRHLEPDEVDAMAMAFGDYGLATVTAVVVDSLCDTAEAYTGSNDATDLTWLSDTLMGINVVLFDSRLICCVVLTAYDFKLIAGPREFLEAVVGDVLAAKREFLAFARDASSDASRALLARAIDLMSWMEPGGAR